MNSSVLTFKTANHRHILITIGAALVAFLAYSSVYAYRKPFTIVTFGGLKYWGVSYQTLLIISQGIGYMLSKFVGIKFISELKTLGRFKAGVLLTGVAWLCLLILGVVPAPWGMLLLLINGFTLGFMWGIIFSYLEGRRTTDLIGSFMAISFIFAGGFTRSVAKWLMINWGIAEKWVPFSTGLLFALPLLILLWLLDKVPPPDEEDIRQRTVRLPMTGIQRKNLLKQLGPGLLFAMLTYLFLTILRDVRDNYMVNIWTELGYGDRYSIFTKTETNTSLIMLLVMAMLVLINRNFKAFSIVHFVIATGLLISGISSALFITGHLDGASWMQLVGLGLYMGYIPFNCIFFERMIASFRLSGNVGFLIYLADAFGYLGSVGIMLTKEIMRLQNNWSQFYSHAAVIGSLIGLAAVLYSWFYFRNKYTAKESS
ncbi:MAG TPA: DUF5690 family protein [Chitinophagaceae bacterium]|nr:DUF5690 family protein [Chitinophagaceae bacterium]